ncbi:unnamed protein product [Kuraishia capsulata CBS 1993]|uniref:Uncharacterized protein n=1 Tax=Kuraishia capsulata CBS 1993 TaxID=1382522 RepID=W6MLG9_9ASCO|nr:uncharacterized protein KUCA_T00002935001 [Kuraishia capsulata CBS 1993]CDK26958.1 unnamed protein product [Kuraishia capsulata CBS 1993]
MESKGELSRLSEKFLLGLIVVENEKLVLDRGKALGLTAMFPERFPRCLQLIESGSVQRISLENTQQKITVMRDPFKLRKRGITGASTDANPSGPIHLVEPSLKYCTCDSHNAELSEGFKNYISCSSILKKTASCEHLLALQVLNANKEELDGFVQNVTLGYDEWMTMHARLLY